jgi:hypothetical protein
MRSEKYFGLLDKWCKTEKLGDAKYKRYKGISEKKNSRGCTRTPSHMNNTVPD